MIKLSIQLDTGIVRGQFIQKQVQILHIHWTGPSIRVVQ